MAIKPLHPIPALLSVPTVYDEEATTVLKLIGRSDGKVNECVETINRIQTETEKSIEAQNKALPGMVEDEMEKKVRDGTFDLQIDAKMGNLEDRVDNLLGSVSDGGTTMDAEVIDARVDASGHTYPNLGASIRGQVAEAQNNMDKFIGVNLLNPNAITGGHINPTFGQIEANEIYYTTDYIPIRKGQTLCAFNSDMARMAMRFVASYDKNKNLIPHSNADGTNNFAEVYSYTQNQLSEDTAFVRITMRYSEMPPQTSMVADVNAGGYAPFRSGKLLETAVPDSLMNLRSDMCFVNVYEPGEDTMGYYVRPQDGLLTDNATYFTTARIPVQAGQVMAAFTPAMSKISCRFVAFYDPNGDFLSAMENVSDIPVPAGARYMRLSTSANYHGSMMIAESTCYRYMEEGGMCVRNNLLPVSNGEVNVSKDMLVAKYQTLEGSKVTLPQFPWYTKKNTSISAYAKFITFTDMSIGRGKTDYGSMWLRVTPSQVEVHTYITEEKVSAKAHGLNISKFLHVLMNLDDNSVLHITLTTANGSYKLDVNTNGYICGELFAETTGSLANLTVSATCKDFSAPVWVLGDSYLGTGPERVLYWLKDFGFNDYLVSAQPGLGSDEAFPELARCLAYGTPKYLIWYLGMNDDIDVFTTGLANVKAICEEYGIKLILNRVPTVPILSKEEHSAAVIRSGCRYIDSYYAVGTDSTGAWLNGYLSSDNVHPTELGARALALRILVDAPEIMGC